MLGEEKNIKDTSLNPNFSIKDTSVSLSYNKADKLIMALYMVTDIMDTNEPIRHKLRGIGSEVISDINILPLRNSIGHIEEIENKIAQIVVFLNIANTVNMISQMNAEILKNEFFKLKSSIELFKQGLAFGGVSSLAEFMQKEEEKTKEEKKLFYVINPEENRDYKGHYSKGQKENRTNIGLQKGSTLMKALSDKVSVMKKNDKDGHGVLKNERRNEIRKILKGHSGGLTISDIRSNATGSIKDCSEKTLQRELASMVASGVLKKTGEKRWSKYSLI